jgi:flagellar hook-associated protein 2
MGSTSAPIFSGVSTYANDLVQVINRAVGIASLPLKQMQSQLQTLNAQASVLTELDSSFNKLRSTITNLGTSLGAQSYSAVSSDPDQLAVSVSAGALESTYSVDITNIGSYTTTISDPGLPAVSDAASSSISTSTAFTLTVNGKTTNIVAPDGTLTGLAQAINGASAGVHASIVNLGGSAAPQYRLVIQGTSLAADTIQLNDGSRDLLNTLSTGTPAEYSINGISGTLQSSSRTITLAPGITANLVQPTVAGLPVTVTVTRDLSSTSGTLSAFADAFNETVDALDHQVGKDSGALSGQTIVRELRESLRTMTQYQSPSGTVSTFSQVGLKLDESGKLTFDAATFNAANVDAVEAFLGSSTSGFLDVATKAMSSVEDPTTGSLKAAQNLLDKQITDQNKLIEVNTQRITDLQTNLQQQMAAARSANCRGSRPHRRSTATLRVAPRDGLRRAGTLQRAVVETSAGFPIRRLRRGASLNPLTASAI